MIDAHHHFWQLSRGDYHWLTADMETLYRDFLPTDLEVFLNRYGVEATVVVQAAETEAETDFLLQLAGKHDFIAGVVGWIDFTAADAADRVRHYAAQPKLKGLRPMVQWAEDGWLGRKDIAPGIRAMAEASLSFDALVFSRQLPDLVAFLGAYPDVPVVVDHLAKPNVAEDDWQHWSKNMAWIARNTDSTCKLSGLITEFPADWTVDSLRRYTEFLLEEFGCARLMWGSDWPVSRLAGGYDAWMTASERLFAQLSSADRRQLFRQTAWDFYRLG